MRLIADVPRFGGVRLLDPDELELFDLQRETVVNWVDEPENWSRLFATQLRHLRRDFAFHINPLVQKPRVVGERIVPGRFVNSAHN